jgi:hypothetical protein
MKGIGHKMNERMIKKTVVFMQLEQAITQIEAKQHNAYLLFKNEYPNAEPQDFVKELISIGLRQYELLDMLVDIEQYYDCSPEIAVLLYSLTDAYQIMRTPLSK